jgi:GT2 family glycosyltransferase
VQAFGARYPFLTVRYLKVSPNHGPAAARNVGWRAARHDIIAFTDDDCIPAPSWLAKGISAIRRAIAVAGRVQVPLPPVPTDYERNESGLDGAEFVTANCFCRREALDFVGGFDEAFPAAWREDSDLYFKLLRTPTEYPERVVRSEDAVVVHPVRPAPWGVSLRQQEKSRYNALLYKKHPDLYRRKIESGAPWNYYGMVASALVSIVASTSGDRVIGWSAAGIWAVLTVAFLVRRLRGTSRDPVHVAEMAVTTPLIPFLSVFWRLEGALKYRVAFF